MLDYIKLQIAHSILISIVLDYLVESILPSVYSILKLIYYSLSFHVRVNLTVDPSKLGAFTNPILFSIH